MNPQYNGIWLSEYEYSSTTQKGDFTGKHYVRAFQEGSHLVFESVPGANTDKSYVILRLTLDSRVATGNWQQTSEFDGQREGVIYYGAVQLIANEAGEEFTGQWAGFGKTGVVKTGPWKLTYVGDSVPKS